jgi:hypothetical protein
MTEPFFNLALTCVNFLYFSPPEMFGIPGIVKTPYILFEGEGYG